MNWRHIRAVWGKEMLDTIRDRRTVLAMIVIPILLMPAITVGFPWLMDRQEAAARSTVSTIAVVGAQASPALVRSLEGSGDIRLLKFSDRSAGFAALKKGEVQLVVDIPPGFDTDIAAGRRPEVKVYYDGASRSSDMARGRFTRAFSRFSQAIVANRLMERQIDPAILTPAEITQENVASKEKMGGFMLAMILPMLIALWASLGGMYTAIDVAAGEKERGTLECL